MPSVQVLGFGDICLLTRHGRLVCGSCSSDQRFACSFLQIPPRGGHPCRPANGSPCRVRRELSSPSECALPGAHRVGPGVAPRVLSHHRAYGSVPRRFVKGIESLVIVAAEPRVQVHQSISSETPDSCEPRQRSTRPPGHYRPIGWRDFRATPL